MSMTTCSLSAARSARAVAALPTSPGCHIIGPKTLLRSNPGLQHNTSRLRFRRLRALILEPTGDGSTEHLEDGGSFAPKTISLQESGMFEIGRDEPADILLQVATVSGRHALLKIVNKQVAITDLGSTNGTYIDGEQLENMAATELKIGSEIVFGDEHLCRYVLLDEDDL